MGFALLFVGWIVLVNILGFYYYIFDRPRNVIIINLVAFIIGLSISSLIVPLGRKWSIGMFVTSDTIYAITDDGNDKLVLVTYGDSREIIIPSNCTKSYKPITVPTLEEYKRIILPSFWSIDDGSIQTYYVLNLPLSQAKERLAIQPL